MNQLYRSAFVLSLLLILLIPSQTEVKASHFMGIDIRMECINTCTSRVYWRAYRDCSGISTFNNTVTFTSPTPGCSAPTVVTPWTTQAIVEVTPICSSLQTMCSNPASTVNGVQEYYAYQDVDFCATPGCDYNLEWSSCCRNAVITSGSANEGFALTNYHSLSQGCNNSPVYTNIPLFYACNGLASSISMGGIDPDGDSLVYSMGTCLTSNTGNQITYAPGYSATAPLGPNWNVTLDPISGMLSVVPNPGANVVGVLCITTSEYRNGVLIGQNTRDIQVTILNCPNNNAPVLSPITNLSPGATLTAGNFISVCPGTPFCFDLEATDPDTANGQSVTLLWDVSIPGATFTEIGNPTNTDTLNGNSPNATFCWNNPVAGFYPVAIGVRDNACPITTYADQIIYISVQSGAFTLPIIASAPSLDTCGTDTVTLSLPGTYNSYAWSNGAVTPTIDVTTTGIYSVTVTSGSCGAIGTGTITIGASAIPAISGTVTLSNGSTPLSNTPIYLITHDPILNSLTAIDSTLTDTMGYYSFCNTQGADTVYLKAAPQLPAYPNHLPTYADTAIYWNNALDFLSTAMPLTVDWSVIGGSNPGGPGFVGGLISAGANKTTGVGDPVPGAQVFLYSTTWNTYIGTTNTDANGYFSFPALPYGDYEISVDVPGVDEVNVPAVTLSSQIPSLDSLDLRLHSTYLELFIPTSIISPSVNATVDIYPNPAQDLQTIRVTLSDAQKMDIALFDLMGRKITSVANGNFDQGEQRFLLQGLSTGTYFLKITIGEAVQTFKVTHQ